MEHVEAENQQKHNKIECLVQSNYRSALVFRYLFVQFTNHKAGSIKNVIFDSVLRDWNLFSSCKTKAQRTRC